MNAPRPIPDEDSKPFWDGCRQGVIRLQRCSGCTRRRYPPSPVCPDCGSSSCEWEEAAGRGRIYSYTVYRRAFHPAFEQDIPYVVAIVELEEGLRLVSRIVDCEADDAFIGMTVRVTFEKVATDLVLPLFVPCRGT